MGFFSWLKATFTSSREPEEPGWLGRLVMPRPGPPNPRVEERKQAAEADVEEIEEDRKHFRQDAPGHSENDL